MMTELLSASKVYLFMILPGVIFLVVQQLDLQINENEMSTMDLLICSLAVGHCFATSLLFFAVVFQSFITVKKDHQKICCFELRVMFSSDWCVVFDHTFSQLRRAISNSVLTYIVSPVRVGCSSQTCHLVLAIVETEKSSPVNSQESLLSSALLEKRSRGMLNLFPGRMQYSCKYQRSDDVIGRLNTLSAGKPSTVPASAVKTDWKNALPCAVLILVIFHKD